MAAADDTIPCSPVEDEGDEVNLLKNPFRIPLERVFGCVAVLLCSATMITIIMFSVKQSHAAVPTRTVLVVVPDVRLSDLGRATATTVPNLAALRDAGVPYHLESKAGCPQASRSRLASLLSGGAAVTAGCKGIAAATSMYDAVQPASVSIVRQSNASETCNGLCAKAAVYSANRGAVDAALRAIMQSPTPLVAVHLEADPTQPKDASLYLLDAAVGQLTAAMFSVVHLRSENWLVVVASPVGGSLFLAAAFTSKGRVQLAGHRRNHEDDAVFADEAAWTNGAGTLEDHATDGTPEYRLYDEDVLPTVLRWFNAPTPPSNARYDGQVRVLCTTGDDALHCN